ncbi:terminase large subunit [Aeromonas salmonicida]|uniref:terminase large subunit n=1 Tax=Aeromonas salmonicida TaxID=645 RepID=UPI003D322EB7
MIDHWNYRVNQPGLVDAHGHSIASDYFQGIESVKQYCWNVLNDKRLAGKAERDAISRFVKDFERDDIRFDESISELVCAVANSLRHSKGPIAGQPIYLLPFLQFVLMNMFCWYFTDKAHPALVGQRRFIKTFFSVARGNAKTQVAAVASICNILLNKNGYPIATSSGPTRNQSDIAFQEISAMIKTGSKGIKKRFRVLTNEIQINSKTGGKIIKTSSEAGNLDGFRIGGLAILDEIHEHKDSSIHDVLWSGMASSADPQMLMITTAGFNTESFGKITYDYAIDVAAGAVTNDRYFSIIYSIDPEDVDKWQDEAIWEKANPSLGHAVSKTSLMANRDESTTNDGKKASFIVKNLNCWYDFDETGYLNLNEFTDCRDHSLKLEDFKGRDCYLGLDLASISDLSSLTFIFPEKDGSFKAFQKSYISRATYNESIDKVQQRYFTAVKNKELYITESNVTDFEIIKQDIVQSHNDFKVIGLGIDAAAGGLRFSEELEAEHRIKSISVKQGFGLSDPAIRLQSAVKEQKFAYNDGLMEWCARNTVQKTGQWGDIAVVRPTDRAKKIDIIISLLIGYSLIDVPKKKGLMFAMI